MRQLELQALGHLAELVAVQGPARGGRRPSVRLVLRGDPHDPPLYVQGPRPPRRPGAVFTAQHIRLVSVKGKRPYWSASGVEPLAASD